MPRPLHIHIADAEHPCRQCVEDGAVSLGEVLHAAQDVTEPGQKIEVWMCDWHKAVAAAELEKHLHVPTLTIRVPRPK